VPGDLLNTAVQIFLPVVIQASVFIVVVNVAIALLDGFSTVAANLKERR
jgi:hypothetical protein